MRKYCRVCGFTLGGLHTEAQCAHLLKQLGAFGLLIHRNTEAQEESQSASAKGAKLGEGD
jgi:hypothetical protein